MRLLIIGDTSTDINTAITIAQEKKAKVIMVENIHQALDFLREGKGADLILIDVKFNIVELITAMKQEHISTPVVAYGVQCTPKEAVWAIKAGAKEFLPLPPDKELIAGILAAVSDNTRVPIGQSAVMQGVIEIADRIAKSNANVLITGRSGTGKEVLANYIHNNSLRANSAFVRVNCAAIPDALLESELFGHEKGAFTGAIARRIGKFEESSGGTLLLDEISEIDIKLQAKLLRALQEHEIDRVGGASPIKVDLRVIATSNRNLLDEIRKGTFREDLYFRLNIIHIELPDLAVRKEDIEYLSNGFIEKYSSSNKMSAKKLSKDALQKMLEYSWPGNVRELENVIHRAVLLCNEDEIQSGDIKIDTQRHGFVAKTIFDAEKELISNTLGYCLGDVNNAANVLGISISVLKEKLRLYTLD